MTDLFPTAQGESPRLRWLREHGVTTIKQPAALVGETCPETGDAIPAWVAGAYDRLDRAHQYGHGETEDDSIADWARRNGVRLWSEQGLQQ